MKRARLRQDEQTLGLAADADDENAVIIIAEAVTGESIEELKDALRDAVSRMGDRERAYSLCLDAVKKNVKSGPLWRVLGELAVGLDKPTEATAHFEKAEGLGEDDSDLYQLWGASEVALGNAPRAAELFGIALEIAHDRVSEVYSAWGKALCDTGALDEAKRKLEVAIAADSTAFYPHAYMGVLQVRTQMLDLAEKSFRRALDLDPPGAYAAWIALELANLLDTRGQRQEARSVIVSAMQRGQRSLALFDKLRSLQGEPLSSKASRYVIVVAGEDDEGEYYEECQVDANNEADAVRFVRAVHDSKEAERLVAADVKITGKAQGPYAGVTDISDKTREPEMNANDED